MQCEPPSSGIRSTLTSSSQRGGGGCIVSHINQVSDPQQTDQTNTFDRQCTACTIVHFHTTLYLMGETYVFVLILSLYSI